jgi:hypothetical protein
MSNSELVETGKIFAQIESESGLKAFEMYMDLQWAQFYANIFGPMICLTLLGGVIFYFWKKVEKSEAAKKGR